jgi:hypothetical protein
MVDLVSGAVEAMHRMPESLYGANYALDQHSDLQAHYVSNDQQTTHINSVAPAGDEKLLVSALIPGAIGVFDLRNGRYTEISRGFKGCHGARCCPDGQIYFSDSCCGCLVFIDEHGHVVQRFDLGSAWMHDAQSIGNGRYVAALADRNCCVVFDAAQGRIVQEVHFLPWKGKWASALWPASRAPLGRSVKFITYHATPSIAGDGSDGVIKPGHPTKSQ